MIATTSLVPIELVEPAREPSVARVVFLVVNVAIVVYLIFRIRDAGRG